MENVMTGATAWMIKNDSTEIPIVTHIYADKDETDELLALAFFLWKNDTDSHHPVREFLDVWAYHSFLRVLKSKMRLREGIIGAVEAYLISKPYRIFPADFTRVIADNTMFLHNRLNGEYVEVPPVEGTDLLYSLNQRFLRARYGGRYDTVQGCRDMYFRVSSVGFDWFPIIRDFVKNYADPIETVTIVRDFESTGCEKYYVDSTNCLYNKMPVSDFLEGSGCTNCLGKSESDSSLNVREVLANGGTVQQLRCLRMNYSRILRRIEILKHKEETHLADE